MDKIDNMDKIEQMNKEQIRSIEARDRKIYKKSENCHENINRHFVNKTFDIKESITSNWFSCTTPSKNNL